MSLTPTTARRCPTPATCLVVTLVTLAGCADGVADLPRLTEDGGRRHASSAATTGDALAAALLLAADTLPEHPSLPRLPVPLSPPAADRARTRALDHLWTNALAGASGASTAGTARARRLAAAPGAPPDRGDDGSNLDDTLLDETIELAALAGVHFPIDGLAPSITPSAAANATLLGSVGPGSGEDLAGLRTRTPAGGTYHTEAIGDALLARALLGAALGRDRRGLAIGDSEREGLLALVGIQQALAIDETLLRETMFDGSALGALVDPTTYDPVRDPRWLPASIELVSHPGLPRAAAGWRVADGASDLHALAAVLRGAARLAWLTDPDQADARLRELFVATPLRPPLGGGTPPNTPSWTGDIQPILHGAAGCLGCHAPPTPNSGFSVATYESVLRGGSTGVPAVVPHDAAASPLWLVLQGPWLPPNRTRPIPRMPFQRPPLPATQIELIRRWIDDGARRDPPTRPPATPPGLALARVQLQNAVALHEVPDGAYAGLLDRRSGTTRSELVDAAASGAALAAASLLVAVDPTDSFAHDAVVRWGVAALDHLSEATGHVVAELDLRTGAPTPASATLRARSSLALGLLVAGRVTQRPDFTTRGSAIAGALIRDSWLPEEGAFATVAGIPARRTTARDAAVVIGLLRELEIAGDASVRPILERFLEVVMRELPFSELDSGGEVLGDGVPDTDANGVLEPGAAGRAPVLADALLGGPGRFVDPTATVTWSRHVLPVFRAHCSGCHLEGAAESNYRLDTAQLAATAGSSQRTPVVPGDPEASLLFQKLSRRTPPVGAQMPFARPPLAPHELQIVHAWIRDGARDR